MTRRLDQGPISQRSDAEPPRVLLVDDDVDYARATGRLLTRNGYNVVAAHSGPDGLKILHGQEIDVVLLDFFMPGMNGDEFVVQLRKFNPHVPVILQTGYSGENPPYDTVRRLDIQGFHDKGDGAEKLLLWTEVGIKASRTIRALLSARKLARGVVADLDRLTSPENPAPGSKPGARKG